MTLYGDITLVLQVINLGLLAVGTVCALIRMSSYRPELKETPPVTILKPLKGCDPGLKANLKSFLSQDYPSYNVVFCVESSKDCAAAIADELIDGKRAYGVCRPSTALNPKVANLDAAWKSAADVVVISDSNVSVNNSYLKTIMSYLQPNVGLVTSAVECFGGEGLGGKLEESFWNTFYFRWTYLAAAVGKPIVIGKSLLFRQSVANAFGGYSAMGKFIGEDYQFKAEIQKLGIDIVLTNKPVRQYVGMKTLKQYWVRNHRWHVLQKNYEPLSFGLMPFQYPFVFGLIGGSWQFLLTTVGIWAFFDWIISLPTSAPFRPQYWLVAQLLAPFVWLDALLRNTVNWRGNKLDVRKPATGGSADQMC